MSLPVAEPLPPMEAETASDLPEGEGWLYEPKWDGFRCLAFRDGDEVRLQSKAAKPLGRYFPEVVAALAGAPTRRFVIDGELVVPVDGRLSFDALLQRIHPAASRVDHLAATTPARLLVFDLLAVDDEDLTGRPLSERRRRLEAFAAANLGPTTGSELSPASEGIGVARGWLHDLGGVDGVVAKELASPYRSGERAGMVKIKKLRTADCVVGGFRYGKSGKDLGSLLLGLYDDEGLLHHVGFCASFRGRDREEWLARVEPLVEPPGFTGNAPGGPSRWATERSAQWQPLRPELVIEVRYDHVTGNRFRHGTKLLRRRPDKPPRQCTLAQLR